MDKIEAAYAQNLDEWRPQSLDRYRVRSLLNSPYLAPLREYPRYRAWAGKARKLIATARPELITLTALEREPT